MAIVNINFVSFQDKCIVFTEVALATFLRDQDLLEILDKTVWFTSDLWVFLTVLLVKNRHHMLIDEPHFLLKDLRDDGQNIFPHHARIKSKFDSGMLHERLEETQVAIPKICGDPFKFGEHYMSFFGHLHILFGFRKFDHSFLAEADAAVDVHQQQNLGVLFVQVVLEGFLVGFVNFLQNTHETHRHSQIRI